jgi:hypothetical protein
MRRVYFSFDYERDLHRVSKIHQLPDIISGAAAGFQSTDVWEQARRRGDAAVKGLINDGLNNTSVTVVCIGNMTTHQKYVTYTIERSLERGNGRLGVTINHLRDQDGGYDPEGNVPPLLTYSGYKVHKYTDTQDLVRWIEEAAEIAAEQGQADHQRRILITQGKTK